MILTGVTNLFCSSGVYTQMYYNSSFISSGFPHVGHLLSVLSGVTNPYDCSTAAPFCLGPSFLGVLVQHVCLLDYCPFKNAAEINAHFGDVHWHVSSEEQRRKQGGVWHACLLPFECWGPAIQSTRRRVPGSVVSLPISV